MFLLILLQSVFVTSKQGYMHTHKQVISSLCWLRTHIKWISNTSLLLKAETERQREMRVQKHPNTNWVRHSFVSDLHGDTNISASPSSPILANQVLGPAKVWSIWVLNWHGVELNITGQYSLPDTSFIALVILLNAGCKDLNPTSSNTKGHTKNTNYDLNRILSLSPLI